MLRVVPRVERGEAMNAGVLLYCRPPTTSARASISTTTGCGRSTRPPTRGDRPGAAGGGRRLRGDPDAGPPGREALGSRFRWLTAPRSTVVQPGPVHTGLTADPDAEADRLLRLLVLPVQP